MCALAGAALDVGNAARNSLVNNIMVVTASEREWKLQRVACNIFGFSNLIGSFPVVKSETCPIRTPHFQPHFLPHHSFHQTV